jgi:hypothetical protein
MSNKAMSIYAEALKRRQKEEGQRVTENKKSETAPKVTRKSTQTRDTSRDTSRAVLRDTLRSDAREKPRGKPRDLPTRDEIQEFSFRLRDELKVKVQAEVPHQWQKELEEVARELNVKKLELYRFVIGEFLDKVKRKQST